MAVAFIAPAGLSPRQQRPHGVDAEPTSKASKGIPETVPGHIADNGR